MLELLETIKCKDSEISGLRTKMLKTKHRLQALKQRLMALEGDSTGLGGISDDDDDDNP